MRRYHITVGAHTTAGGVVVSGSSQFIINGAHVALENDKIACRSCKSTGYILCTGPRNPESYEGRPVALENDFCICGCNPPPRLIPSQSLRFQTMEGSSVAAVGTGASSAFQESKESSENHKYDQHLILVDHEGQPLEGIPYRIIKQGAVIEGKTGADGKTQIVSGNDGETLGCEIALSKKK